MGTETLYREGMEVNFTTSIPESVGPSTVVSLPDTSVGPLKREKAHTD